MSYVPLKWSTSLAQSAQGYANKLVAGSPNECRIQHGFQNDRYGGENLNANWGRAQTPDEVLKGWVEDEERFAGGTFSQYGHFTQAIWRATRYVGCASASIPSRNCRINVCRYIAPGNCGLNANGPTPNWKELTIAGSSRCNPQCPPEGCF